MTTPDKEVMPTDRTAPLAMLCASRCASRSASDEAERGLTKSGVPPPASDEVSK